MLEKTVFILMECTAWEGCRPLVVFERKEAAGAFKQLAEEYDAKQPKTPYTLAAEDVCEEEREAYSKALAEWSNHHPVKEGFSGADNYVIQESRYL